MKPLDFVITPKGALAIVTEVNDTQIDGQVNASIEFIGENTTYEHSAWWSQNELKVVDNLPSILARCMVHPFGSGKGPALRIYPRIKPNS